MWRDIDAKKKKKNIHFSDRIYFITFFFLILFQVYKIDCYQILTFASWKSFENSVKLKSKFRAFITHRALSVPLRTRARDEKFVRSGDWIPCGEYEYEYYLTRIKIKKRKRKRKIYFSPAKSSPSIGV